MKEDFKLRTRTIELEHSETTCASSPGVFCRMLRSKGLQRYVCNLYEKPILEDKPCGSLMRCKECLEERDAIPWIMRRST